MEVNKKAVALLVEHMRKSYKASTPSAIARGMRAVAPDEVAAKSALRYLDVFGYLGNALAEWKDVNLGDIVDAVKQFQGFFGVKRSGILCAKTLRAMQQPRCGCPDIVRERHTCTKRIKAFARASLPRWRKAGITYAIQNYVPGISKQDFESVVFNAFQNWCQYGNVDVQPARNPSQQVDIIIATGRGQQDNFDGPSGVLAWAYMPDGNDQQLVMKFDLDETWVLTPAQRGILIDAVTTHEFGHLMGLDHSKLQSSLMAPYYNAGIRVPQQQDDIPRFQARYGVKQNPAPSPVPTPGAGSLVVQGQFSSIQLNGQKIL